MGTGNPGKIKIGFKHDGQPVAFSGHVHVYGRTQVPIPGFKPEPLASFKVENSKEFTLSAQEVSTIPDSAWPKSSVSDDGMFDFNLVVDAESTGSLIQNLVFDPSRNKIFHIKGSAGDTILTEPQIEISISRKKSLRVLIRSEEMLPNHFNFLFVRGTGFFSLADDSIFIFPLLPDESYTLHFLSLPNPKRSGLGINEDSTSSHETSHPVTMSAIDTISIGTASEYYRIPDQYKSENKGSF